MLYDLYIETYDFVLFIHLLVKNDESFKDVDPQGSFLKDKKFVNRLLILSQPLFQLWYQIKLSISQPPFPGQSSYDFTFEKIIFKDINIVFLTNIN